jgi:hypothetical protein
MSNKDNQKNFISDKIGNRSLEQIKDDLDVRSINKSQGSNV